MTTWTVSPGACSRCFSLAMHSAHSVPNNGPGARGGECHLAVGSCGWPLPWYDHLVRNKLHHRFSACARYRLDPSAHTSSPTKWSRIVQLVVNCSQIQSIRRRPNRFKQVRPFRISIARLSERPGNRVQPVGCTHRDSGQRDALRLADLVRGALLTGMPHRMPAVFLLNEEFVKKSEERDW